MCAIVTDHLFIAIGSQLEKERHVSSSGRQMSTRVIGGEGGAAAAAPPPSATRHSSSSISSSSSSSEQEPDNCHGEDAQEDDDDDEEEEEEQQQQHNGHGGDGGFVPNPAKKQRQQYRATESAKKQQTTRDLRITSTLLHPEHSMALGVWTSTGHVKSCSKGIGTDIKLRILSPRANSNPLLLPLPSLHPSIRPGTSFLFEINKFKRMGGEGGV